jgi:hypothetical protein
MALSASWTWTPAVLWVPWDTTCERSTFLHLVLTLLQSSAISVEEKPHLGNLQIHAECPKLLRNADQQDSCLPELQGQVGTRIMLA